MKALMQKSAAHPFRKQYFGLVIDNFTCKDPVMGKSLATLMGEFLFYHIVDTVQTAERIIGAFNEANMPGEINFFVLDIIKIAECDGSDTISQSFCYNAEYQKVFAQIFQIIPWNIRDLWCKSPDGFDSLASVLDGVIEKDGALTATNSDIDSASDPLQLYEKKQNLLELDEATRYERSENSYRMDATICNIDMTSKSLSKQYNTITTIKTIESCLAQANQQIKLCANRIHAAQAEVEKYEIKVNELTDTMNRCESELKLDLLSPAEAVTVERTQNLIDEKQKEMQQVNEGIERMTAKRDIVVEFFNKTLMSRYNTIRESTLKFSNASAELNAKQHEQLEWTDKKLNAEANLNAVRRQIGDLHAQRESKKNALRDSEQLKLELQRRQNDLFAALNDMEIRRKTLTTEYNQLIVIRPPDATKLENRDLLDMSEAEVNNQLDVARHQLQTYQNTKSFDLNILETFKGDRANFVRRRAELSKLGEKISSAMEQLDANINSSIESTFDDLAQHFARIFKHFVSDGSARLHLIKVGKNEPDANAANNAIFTGLEIFVQFSDGIEKPFDDLLGQQRRVVCIAFIICMQLLCPSPFYVFDCIDEVKFNVSIFHSIKIHQIYFQKMFFFTNALSVFFSYISNHI